MNDYKEALGLMQYRTMRYKIAVIGVGVVGKLHLDVIKELANAEAIAVVDVREDEGKATASKYGLKWYSDYMEMIENEKPDMVSVCLPHFLHSKVVCDAARAGVNVLVEKPMAISIKESDRMISMAKRSGIKLGVVFQNRERAIAKRLKKIVADGTLGDLMRALLEFNTFRSQAYYSSAGWRGRWQTEGGGVLINQGIHHLDLFQWVIGKKPRRLCAFTNTMAHDIEVEDLATSIIEFEECTQAAIQMSTIDHPTICRIELRGQNAYAEFDDKSIKLARNNPTIGDRSKLQEMWATPELTLEEIEEPKEEAKKLHEAVYLDFLDSMTHDRQPAVSGEEGRKSVEIVNAIVASSFTRRPVRFPLDADKYEQILRKLSKSSRKK